MIQYLVALQGSLIMISSTKWMKGEGAKVGIVVRHKTYILPMHKVD